MLYVYMGVKVKVSEPLEVVQFLQKNLKIAFNMGSVIGLGNRLLWWIINQSIRAMTKNKNKIKKFWNLDSLTTSYICSNKSTLKLWHMFVK